MTLLAREKTVFESDSPDYLKTVLEDGNNVAVWKRNVDHLTSEVSSLVKNEVHLRVGGTVEEIVTELAANPKFSYCPEFIDDVRHLLKLFGQTTGAESFKLFIGAINTNMCRRFHYDMNHLRMLCTYVGPGTLWLEEDNVNRNALEALEGNENIVLDDDRIRQASPGDVVLLKGALYPSANPKPAVHRSPTIEEAGQERLLLRVDSN